jgi:hypothetical protein
MSAGGNQDAFLTDDDFDISPFVGFIKRTGTETYAIVTDNSTTWDKAGTALQPNETETITAVYTFNARPAFNGGASGSTSPFTVDSNTKVTNLNADYLDGISSGSFLRSDTADTVGGKLTYNVAPEFGSAINGAPFTVNAVNQDLVANLNANFLGGYTSADLTKTLTRGSYLTGSNYNGLTARTWGVDATTTSTASKVVARDASKNIYVNNVYFGV